MATVTRAATLAEYQALATAIPKHLPNFTFLIASQTYTTAEVMTIVNTLLNSAAALAAAKSTVHTADIADDQVELQYGGFIKELRQVIGVAFNNVPATLTEFAMSPKKVRAPLSTAAKAAAQAKAKATRTARGTTGKKAKAAIKGSVTGVNITPVALPATQPSGPSTPSSGTTGSAPSAPVAAPAASGTTPHA